MLILGPSGFDPGCVKTLEAIVTAQQTNRIRRHGESFIRAGILLE
jgi:hypothetical protein